MSLCMNQLLVAVISFLFVTSALFYDTVLGIMNCSISFLSCLCKFKIDYSMLDLLPTCHHFSYQLLWDLELVAGRVAIGGEGGGWLRIACTTLSCLNFMVYGAPRAGLWNDWNLWNHIFRVPRKRTSSSIWVNWITCLRSWSKDCRYINIEMSASKATRKNLCSEDRT